MASSSRGYRRRRMEWDQNMQAKFIDLLYDHEASGRQPKWEDIGKEVTAATGVPVTGNQAKEKFKRLRYEYQMLSKLLQAPQVHFNRDTRQVAAPAAVWEELHREFRKTKPRAYKVGKPLPDMDKLKVIFAGRATSTLPTGTGRTSDAVGLENLEEDLAVEGGASEEDVTVSKCMQYMPDDGSISAALVCQFVNYIDKRPDKRRAWINMDPESRREYLTTLDEEEATLDEEEARTGPP